MYITFWYPDIIPIAIMWIMSVLLIITPITKWGLYPLPNPHVVRIMTEKLFIRYTTIEGRLLTKRIKFGKTMGCVAGHNSENFKPRPKVGYLKNYKG